MTLKEIDKHIIEFKEYLNVIIDINCNGHIYRSKHQLPSFDFYKTNVINDRGGNYDFTLRRYITHPQIILHFGCVLHEYRVGLDSAKEVRYKYSMWMGIPFNFELQTQLKNK